MPRAALGFRALPESHLSDTKILTHKRSVQGHQGSRKHRLLYCARAGVGAVVRGANVQLTLPLQVVESRSVEMPTQQSGFESLKTGPLEFACWTIAPLISKTVQLLQGREHINAP